MSSTRAIKEHLNIVWSDEDYAIAVNRIGNATYVSAWYLPESKKVGALSTGTYKKLGNETYLNIADLGVDKPHRRQGLATRMYEALLENLAPNLAGITSYLPNRSNRSAVPKIYRRFGGYVSPENADYAIIPRPRNVEIIS